MEYKWVKVLDGVVIEIFDTVRDENGDIVPFNTRFTPQFIEELFDVTNISPSPKEGWLLVNATKKKLEFKDPDE